VTFESLASEPAVGDETLEDYVFHCRHTLGAGSNSMWKDICKNNQIPFRFVPFLDLKTGDEDDNAEPSGPPEIDLIVID